MGTECPHCTKDLGSGYLSQEVHEARLASQKSTLEAKADLVQGQLKDARSALAKARASASELESLRARAETAEGLVQAADQATALRAAGVEERYHASLLTLYQAHSTSQEEGAEPVSLADYLAGPAREDPVLGGILPAEEAESGEVPVEPLLQASRLPRSNRATAVPPTHHRQLTPERLREYFRSADFLALPSADREAKLQELEARHS